IGFSLLMETLQIRDLQTLPVLDKLFRRHDVEPLVRRVCLNSEQLCDSCEIGVGTLGFHCNVRDLSENRETWKFLHVICNRRDRDTFLNRSARSGRGTEGEKS